MSLVHEKEYVNNRGARRKATRKKQDEGLQRGRITEQKGPNPEDEDPNPTGFMSFSTDNETIPGCDPFLIICTELSGTIFFRKNKAGCWLC